MEKLNFLFLSGFLTLGIFIGGVNLPYYVLPLSIFSVYGVILFGICAEKAVIFARSRMAVNTCTCVDNDPAEHAGRKEAVDSISVRAKTEAYYVCVGTVDGSSVKRRNRNPEFAESVLHEISNGGSLAISVYRYNQGIRDRTSDASEYGLL